METIVAISMHTGVELAHIWFGIGAHRARDRSGHVWDVCAHFVLGDMVWTNEHILQIARLILFPLLFFVIILFIVIFIVIFIAISIVIPVLAE